jgi:hypothetical protein
MTYRILSTVLLLAPLAATPLAAQVEGPVSTQALLRSTSKTGVMPAASALMLKVNDRSTTLTSLQPVLPSNTQVALLIDDGLTRNVGIQLNDLRSFATSLPPQTELLIGYMTNGTVSVVMPFTTDHEAAAAKIRLPFGVPGQSASPYFCLSEFVKHWPSGGDAESDSRSLEENAAALHKARFVMMITNGVDPYNGSTSVLNQDSPYVKTAIEDAQRAGASVSSIYYRDSGFRNGSAAFSGQSYLNQLAEGTGGESYYQGLMTPVALAPYFKQFVRDLSETYIASFPANADGHDHLVSLKFSSEGPKLKLRYPEEVRPGNQESAAH